MGQLVGVGAFEFGQTAVFQNTRRQGVVFCQLLKHFFIGTARARGCFLNDGQTQLVKKDLAQLLRTAQVERLAGNVVGFRFQLHNALP